VFRVPSSLEEKDVGISVEVESGKGHDDVEEEMLEWYEDPCCGVIGHDARVIGGPERFGEVG
jgi:hypothetical protein